ncbi:MAG: pyrroline-5-carboxylate reductase dimerization domain-containing protein, partial [Acidobacteriota bacterium]
ISIAKLEEKFGRIKIIKALPNINWQICKGATLFDCNDLVTSDDISYFEWFLGDITRLYRVNRDADFDRISALTSCLPGLFAEVIRQICLTYKIVDEKEKELFHSALYGTIKYIVDSNKECETIVNEVANKGGLTEVGISTLRNHLPNLLNLLKNSLDIKIVQRKENLNRR